MYHILGIAGSMRPGGNTEVTVRAILDGAVATGHATAELITLRDRHIEFCRGCYQIHGRPGHPCAIDDDMTELRGKMLDADAIVFGSPAYFGGMTGLLRTFLDRTGPVRERMDGMLAAIAAVGADRFGGQELVAQDIAVFCRAHRMELVGWPLCLQTPADDKPGSLGNDPEAMEQAAAMGRAIIDRLRRGLVPRRER